MSYLTPSTYPSKFSCTKGETIKISVPTGKIIMATNSAEVPDRSRQSEASETHGEDKPDFWESSIYVWKAQSHAYNGVYVFGSSAVCVTDSKLQFPVVLAATS